MTNFVQSASIVTVPDNNGGFTTIEVYTPCFADVLPASLPFRLARATMTKTVPSVIHSNNSLRNCPHSRNIFCPFLSLTTVIVSTMAMNDPQSEPVGLTLVTPTTAFWSISHGSAVLTTIMMAPTPAAALQSPEHAISSAPQCDFSPALYGQATIGAPPKAPEQTIVTLLMHSLQIESPLTQ